jgi:hypothetical protein
MVMSCVGCWVIIDVDGARRYTSSVTLRGFAREYIKGTI